MLTLTPEEFLAGIARITSFEELGIPNYTQTQWQKLPPLIRIEEALRIRDRGETLDTRVSENYDWRLALGWATRDHIANTSKFEELKKKGYTLREYLEQVWLAEFGEKGFAEYIKYYFCEPYFTNNLETNLRDVWEGKRPPSSAYGPELLALVEDFKKKTGWNELAKIEAKNKKAEWEKDRAFYPLNVFLKRRGLNLAR